MLIEIFIFSLLILYKVGMVFKHCPTLDIIRHWQSYPSNHLSSEIRELSVMWDGSRCQLTLTKEGKIINKPCNTRWREHSWLEWQKESYLCCKPRLGFCQVPARWARAATRSGKTSRRLFWHLHIVCFCFLFMWHQSSSIRTNVVITRQSFDAYWNGASWSCSLVNRPAGKISAKI